MYNLYFSITKEDFKKALPAALQGKYARILTDSEGVETIIVPDSWEQAYEMGYFPWVRECLDWDTQGMDNNLKIAIIKDEFSIIDGEVSALQAMGEGKEYPFNSVLNKSEVQILSSSPMFTQEVSE
jgi:hypothetical protein